MIESGRGGAYETGQNDILDRPCVALEQTWHNMLAQNLYAQYNPFRYRGYYYDTDTQFYYLQSRYYDPVTGRFMNADGYINANGDLIGFNMYAYCNNNPVMYTDPTGEIFEWLASLKDKYTNSDFYQYFSGLGESIGDYVFNQDESVVFNNTLSFYNGVPVIRTSLLKDRAFSCGIIFMGTDSCLGTATLKHEYGHARQLQKYGADKYLVYVALPSLYCYWTGAAGNNYYDMPWERGADVFGRVTATDLTNSYRKNKNYSQDSFKYHIQYNDFVMNVGLEDPINYKKLIWG